MLTQDEENYLAKIDPARKVIISAFDPKARETGDRIVKKITDKLPTARVLFMGATALGIAGQNDIDIYVLSESSKFGEHLPTLEELFGKHKSPHDTFIEWSFTENEYPVELYLTEPPERQIKVYEILESSKKLLKEYEELKLKFNGKSLRDYQRAKYEFYSRILNSHRILPTNPRGFLGRKVEVIVDRPFGSKHPKHGFEYETNYGYVANTISPDGEELDAYYIGINEPLKKASGICIAIIHRTNDNDDKLIVVPEGTELTDEEIEKLTNFQEQWFEHEIISKA